jgi:hypothetical protein
MTNVNKVLGLLLFNTPDWTSLKDLATYWNQQHQLSSTSGSLSAIEVEQSILSFRAPFSDTEKIHREIGSIRFLGRNYQLDIELEDSHGLAAVKHRRIGNTGVIQSLTKTVHDYWLQQRQHITSGQPPVTDIFLLTLQSLLLNDSMVDALHIDMKARERSSDQVVIAALLSAQWGEERNAVRTTDEGGLTAVGAVTNSIATAEAAKSRTLGRQALELVLNLSSSTKLESDRRASLFAWVLTTCAGDLNAEDISRLLFLVPDAAEGFNAEQVQTALTKRPDHKLLTAMLLRDSRLLTHMQANSWNMNEVRRLVLYKCRTLIPPRF